MTYGDVLGQGKHQNRRQNASRIVQSTGGNALIVAAALLMTSAIPCAAQQNPFGGLLGGIINAVQVGQAREEWKTVDPKLLGCFKGLDFGPEDFAKNGIGPNDSKAKKFFSDCQARARAFNEWNAVDPALVSCFRGRFTPRPEDLVAQGKGTSDPDVGAALNECKGVVAQEAEQKKAEQARKAEEAHKAETARKAEQERQAFEARKAEEARKAAEEARKAAEEARKVAEEAARIEAKKRAEEAARQGAERKKEAAALAEQKRKKEAEQEKQFKDFVASLSENEKGVFFGVGYLIFHNSNSDKVTRNLAGTLISVSSAAGCALTTQDGDYVGRAIREKYHDLRFHIFPSCTVYSVEHDFVALDTGHLGKGVLDQLKRLLELFRNGEVELYERLPAKDIDRLIQGAVEKDRKEAERQQAELQAREKQRLAEAEAQRRADEARRRAEDPAATPDFSDYKEVLQKIYKMRAAMYAENRGISNRATMAQLGIATCSETLNALKVYLPSFQYYQPDTGRAAWYHCHAAYVQFSNAR